MIYLIILFISASLLFYQCHEHLGGSLSSGPPLHSEIRCDEQGMSCLVTMLRVSGDGRMFLHVDESRSDFYSFAGLFGHFGIGDPAVGFYIDAWTVLSARVFAKKRVRDGFKRMVEERAGHPHRRYIPIYLTSSPIPDNVGVLRGISIFAQVLWPDNFFRKVYIGAAALTTCLHWFKFCERPSIILLDKGSGHLFDPIGKVTPLSNNSIYEMAVLGISKRSLLPEQDILMLDNPDLGLLSHGYKSFSASARGYYAKEQCPHLKSIFVYRRGNNRRVINWVAIVSALGLSPVIFEDLDLPMQMCLASHVETMVAAHGAALSHILFMPKHASVIEMFPCGFKKTIYRNLATVMGIKYRWSQAGDPDDCPELPADPLDWSDMRSKNKYRRQNFHVNEHELRAVFNAGMHGKYLMYMPWEQFNNQLVEFRCACATAAILNRTLVLPELGHPRESASQRRVYDPKEYTWQPWSRYFNTSHMLANPVCTILPASAVYGQVRWIDQIYFRRLGATYNTRYQPEAYYYHIAGLAYRHHRSLAYNLPIYSNAKAIVEHFGKYDRKVKFLALGNAFWLYNFNVPLEYPQWRYVDVHAHSAEYRLIEQSMVHSARLARTATAIIRDRPYGAVHWRRGDYKQKCMAEPASQSCWPSVSHLMKRVREHDPQRQRLWVLLTNTHTCQRVARVFRKHGFRLQCVHHDSQMDPIERGVVDQLVGVSAKVFIGNMYSSFTRTIVDKRNAAGKPSAFL